MFESYKLSDSSIAQIGKVLQVAILTGTDITDNLRLMEFVQVSGKLALEPTYEKNFNKNLENMMEQVSNLTVAEGENE